MFTSTHERTHSLPLLMIALTLLAVLSFMFSMSFGSVHLSLSQIEQAFRSTHHSIAHTIIFNLRLPRTCTAFVTGGLLALAGALMQTLLRNPLADPYVLGISGGAAVTTLLAMLLGLASQYLSLWAFAGSFLSIFLVMGLSRSNGSWSALRLLLTGVVVATGWAAVISFILTVAPNQNLRGMLFWLMGDLSYAHFSIWPVMILLFGLVMSLSLAKPLNLLARGDLAARSLGVNTNRLNLFLYIISSLLTACAVSIAGCIGFVGLIVPHMLRLIKNSDHRFILPASVLLGGSLLTLADTFARTLLAPTQLPVGIVTAMIGVPCFLLLLQRGLKQ